MEIRGTTALLCPLKLYGLLRHTTKSEIIAGILSLAMLKISLTRLCLYTSDAIFAIWIHACILSICGAPSGKYDTNSPCRHVNTVSRSHPGVKLAPVGKGCKTPPNLLRFIFNSRFMYGEKVLYKALLILSRLKILSFQNTEK